MLNIQLIFSLSILLMASGVACKNNGSDKTLVQEDFTMVTTSSEEMVEVSYIHKGEIKRVEQNSKEQILQESARRVSCPVGISLHQVRHPRK